ncbi:MAG: Sir2 family NAD-dependent protein deacetylase [Myxococcota bacterium]
MSDIDPRSLARAREALSGAEALLVCAGAGMGVDSGLPDFRGDEGFWKAYPPFKALGLRFAELANPQWFERDPGLAWGFYGHRLHLYRDTVPHAGFGILRDFGTSLPGGVFAFTSNVDGHFQKAGFAPDGVCEVHGSIGHLQCWRPHCASGIWDAADVRVDVDPATLRAREPFPRCPACDGVARPNILMFGDWGWRSERSDQQEERLGAWLGANRQRKVVIVELGAGLAVPTVRACSERVAARYGATLVRINPREPVGPPGSIGLAGPGLATLRAIMPPG